jgi:signal transduction histidine kinase
MHRLSNFIFGSIYRRIFLGFSIVVVLIIVVGVVNYVQLIQSRELSEEAIPQSNQMGHLQEYVVALASLDANLDRLFAIGGTEIRQEIATDLEEMSVSIEAIQASAATDLDPELDQLTNLTEQMTGDVDGLLTLMSSDADTRELNEATLQVFVSIEEARQAHETLSDLTLEQLQNNIRNQEDVLTGTITQAGFLAVIAVGVAIAASLYVSRSIAGPLSIMSETTSKIAQGNYSERVNVKRQDEVGKLADSFNQMASSIQKQTKDLRRATREANEASRLKDEFLSIMSHELRTPLNAMIGFLGIVLMTEKQLTEKGHHRIVRARANSERLLDLINDILDISRIESGRLQLVPTPINVREAVEQWRAQMSVLAEEKGLAFNVEIDEQLPETVNVDEDAFAKIVTNLLGNAFKFTEEGQVDLSINQENHSWIIEVKDTGVGIPAHMHQIIFERFRQVDGSSKREFGGSGLGLAITSSLVEAMDGTINVDSAPNEGAKFTVRLPLINTVQEARVLEGAMA